MTQTGIARRKALPIRILSTVALAALLTGCQALQGADATRTDSGGGLSNAQLVERDIEAPEVFSVEDDALWDGRPSLGGVWIAAPDVRKPERVIMRNPANGKFVIGALFKKEHAGDGIGLMLSSDAATALGVPAGQPSIVSVVALRTAEEPTARTEAFTPEGVTSADGYLDDGSAAEAEPALETASLGEETADDLANPVTGAAVATTALDAVEAAPDSPLGNLDRIAAAVDAVDGVDAAAEPIEAAPTALAEADAETLSPEPAPDLAAQVAAAVAATEAAEEAARSEGRYVPVAQTGAVSTVTTTTLGAATGKPVTREYVQIGTYSREAGAREAAAKFDGTGIGAEVKEATSGGRTTYRVVIGPVQTTDQQSATLRTAKELGFDDAYPVGG